MKTFKVNVRTLTTNWINHFNRVFKLALQEGVDMCHYIELFSKNATVLAKNDMNGIREMFKSGYALCLLSRGMYDSLVYEHRFNGAEIRVYTGNPKRPQLIGVIIESEIEL